MRSRERKERPFAGLASRNQLHWLNRGGLLVLRSQDEPVENFVPLKSQDVRELVGEVIATLPAGKVISDYTRQDTETDLGGV